MRDSMSHEDSHPQSQTVRNDTDRGDNSGKDVDENRDSSLSDHPSSEPPAQAGVRRIEAVSKAWTKTSLIVAYVTYALSVHFLSSSITI